MSFDLSPVMSPVFPSDIHLGIPKDATPLAKSSSFQVYIQLAEPIIFLQGFSPTHWEGRPPAILRGSLILRVLKSTKLKSINLTFKGTSKTEWPEGIPPKKQEFVELNDVVKHTWPFFQSDLQSVPNNQSTEPADLLKGSNASLFRPLHDDMDKPMARRHSNAQMRSLSPIGNFLRSTSKDIPNVKMVSETFSDMLSISNSVSDISSVKSNGNSSSATPGPFIFHPGDYIFSFEHAIPLSYPETITATFGQVEYFLLVNIERQGAFKSDVNAKLPITIVRTPSDNSVEETEPIAISRDWNTHLHYDIMIVSKDIVLDAFLPIAFRITPMDKVALHRIRIFLTETLEYYCKGKKVHRLEPTKKFLLTEHRAPPIKDIPPDAVPTKAKYLGNLLEDEHGDLVTRDFKYQVFFPERLNYQQKIHPDTSYGTIKSNHWIKISLRLSKKVDGVKKHFEISIDSPIHVLNKLSSHANTLLPSYDTHAAIPHSGTVPFGDSDFNMYHDSNLYFPKQVINSPVMSPEVQPLDEKIGLSPVSLSPVAHNRTSLSLLQHRNLSHSELSISELNLRNKVLQSPELSSNIYQPEHIHAELASPQALPLSPISSPTWKPISLGQNQTIDAVSLDDELPPFQEALKAEPIPVDPPTYLESVATDSKTTKSKSSSEASSAVVPEICLSYTTDLVDEDIAAGFHFNGNDSGSLNLPAAMMRSHSHNDRTAVSRKSSVSGRRRSSIIVPDSLPSTIKNSSESFNDLEHVLSAAGNDESNGPNERYGAGEGNEPDDVFSHSSAETIQKLEPSQSHTNSISTQPLLLRQVTTEDDQESKASMDLTAMIGKERTSWHPLQSEPAMSPLLSQSYSMNVLQSNHALEDFKNNLERYNQRESPEPTNISDSIDKDLLNM
ncbi:Aly1/Aly2 [Kluyveromyces lactis]|nr:Aly1/Aly2 [Kluyveromyces lactis]